MDNNLWLFDYEQGQKYEEFSKCEDSQDEIINFLTKNYDFSNKTVLEIGAGSGKFTPFLSKQCNQLFVVEKSKSLMKINQEKNAKLANVQYLLSDVKDIKFANHSIDIIFAGWSFTSMRDLYDILLPMFKQILKKDGIIILVENAGNDEFCKIIGIEDFTKEIENKYLEMGFKKRTILDTVIKLPNEKVFHDAFPKFNNLCLNSLNIQHKVLIMDMNLKIKIEKEEI